MRDERIGGLVQRWLPGKTIQSSSSILLVRPLTLFFVVYQDCEKGPEEGAPCKDLLPFIEKGGCYRQCAEGWSQNHIDGVAKEFDCDDGEIEETLGRMSKKEVDKMVEKADCKSSESYCVRSRLLDAVVPTSADTLFCFYFLVPLPPLLVHRVQPKIRVQARTIGSRVSRGAAIPARHTRRIAKKRSR